MCNLDDVVMLGIDLHIASARRHLLLRSDEVVVLLQGPLAIPRENVKQCRA